MKKIQVISAVCAALSGFMFGVLSLFEVIVKGDLMLIPFTIIGFLGAGVMLWNARPEQGESSETLDEMRQLLKQQADEIRKAQQLLAE